MLFEAPSYVRDAQEIFDTVATHLLKQNCKSVINDKACNYRGKGGMACAAGCLIPDNEYSPKMERISANHSDFTNQLSEVRKMEFIKHSVLIRALQILHDSNAPKYWREELEKTAEEYGLKFNEAEYATANA